MGVNPETLPLGGAAPAPSRSVSSVASVALSVLLLCSAMLNVAQYTRGVTAVPEMAKLGWGSFGPKTHSFARMEDPQRDGRCNNGLVHMCIDEVSAASSATAGATGVAGVGQSKGESANAGQDGVDSNPERGVVPGEDAVDPAVGGARYCRKDTWLLSCLFYKADVNDELTDWKSVKTECDREPLCDGVNKYWTSDLWHISSSGDSPGCDNNLRDGNGTDASAFYKEGSHGWLTYSRDGSCHEVDEWGNPMVSK
mmetsp:Transcript_7035/g.11015  ORF Transcript_7035/g.11015 Transcript_7035/m.11015 type:complete len:254 (+) Transcript_7035:283-1044(+)